MRKNIRLIVLLLKSLALLPGQRCTEYCEFYNEKQVVFVGQNFYNDFFKWLFGDSNKGYTCFAHNFRAYDGYFVMQYAQENTFAIQHVENGGKIMMLESNAHKMKFLDSLNFIPMALKKLPKSFDLHELKKGYFPHLFNTIGNQEYIGKMPDKEYFDPDGMSSSERKDFLKWYDENKDVSNYNFKDEMKAYCASDVDILHWCIINFRKLFLETTGVDPFESCITIASACNMVYRTNFLKPNTIGIIPTSGYRHNDVQSKEALQWMKYLELSRGIQIKRSGFGGEQRVGKYKIDGTYLDVNGQKVALEYAGCFWHGHSKCYSGEIENPQKHKTMKDLESEFHDKIKDLERVGYKVKFIWGCEFKNLQTGS